jgi:hypothetical protein
MKDIHWGRTLTFLLTLLAFAAIAFSPIFIHIKELKDKVGIVASTIAAIIGVIMTLYHASTATEQMLDMKGATKDLLKQLKEGPCCPSPATPN